MGVPLVKVATELVETFHLRQGRGAFVPESPFSDESRAVPILFEQLCTGVIGGRKRAAIPVSTNRRGSRVLAGHEAVPRRSANSAAGVKIRKPHAFLREFVDVW